LSQLLSEVTVTSCIFASNIQCVRFVPGRRTLKMSCYRSPRLVFSCCF